jgi:hypothetical protein
MPLPSRKSGRLSSPLPPFLRRVRCDRRGAALVEFAFVATALVCIMLPMIDIGMGFYYRTQVMTAAQGGAQWAFVYGWQEASTDAQPNIASAITTATSLSILPSNYSVSLQCGCVNGKTILLLSTPLGSFHPAQCLKESCPAGYDSQPGAFVTVDVHDVKYTPLFPGMTYLRSSSSDGSVSLSARSTVRIQ